MVWMGVGIGCLKTMEVGWQWRRLNLRRERWWEVQSVGTMKSIGLQNKNLQVHHQNQILWTNWSHVLNVKSYQIRIRRQVLEGWRNQSKNLAQHISCNMLSSSNMKTSPSKFTHPSPSLIAISKSWKRMITLTNLPQSNAPETISKSNLHLTHNIVSSSLPLISFHIAYQLNDVNQVF